jgi:hypothetical protein
MAARFVPNFPDYEAYLGLARYRADVQRGGDVADVARRERSIAEKALFGRRPWPRAQLALGLLCAADDDGNAARWHLREALECDPNLASASAVLQRMGG